MFFFGPTVLDGVTGEMRVARGDLHATGEDGGEVLRGEQGRDQPLALRARNRRGRQDAYRGRGIDKGGYAGPPCRGRRVS